MKHRHSRDQGFTLIELSVAIGVAVLMMFIVHQVFSSSAAAVRRGNHNATIMRLARAINEQITEDFKGMLEPDRNGMLIILNREIAEVKMLTRPGDPRLINPDPLADTHFSFLHETITSDQIVFVRQTDGGEDARPICPSSAVSYTYDIAGQKQPPRALVWYGHGKRTMPDGRSAPDELGEGEDPLDPNPDRKILANEIGTNWILGRHALFLSKPYTAAPTGPHPIYVNGIHADADIVHPAWMSFSSSSSAGGPAKRYMGFSDYTHLSHADVRDALNAVTGTPSYLDEAYRYTFGADRLWVNPAPDGTNYYASWKVGQMHAVLGVNISDFEVSFAGDYNTPIGIDEDAGSIKWYRMGDSPAADLTTRGFHVTDATDATPSTVANLQHANAAYVWEHKGDPTAWPSLVRIRYRIHDINGLLTSGEDGSNPISGRWFELILKVNRGI